MLNPVHVHKHEYTSKNVTMDKDHRTINYGLNKYTALDVCRYIKRLCGEGTLLNYKSFVITVISLAEISNIRKYGQPIAGGSYDIRNGYYWPSDFEKFYNYIADKPYDSGLLQDYVYPFLSEIDRDALDEAMAKAKAVNSSLQKPVELKAASCRERSVDRSNPVDYSMFIPNEARNREHVMNILRIHASEQL